LRAETRALVEESSEEGIELVNDARFLADPLWEEWGVELTEHGMGYERLLEIARGYKGEIRLWVMGERPWNHCVAGLRGRVIRRLPQRSGEQRPELVSCARGDL
jgi:hypothetical protein